MPKATYLLAAPSTPPEVHEEAINWAEKGEKITTLLARQLVTKVRRMGKRIKALPSEKLVL